LKGRFVEGSGWAREMPGKEELEVPIAALYPDRRLLVPDGAANGWTLQERGVLLKQGKRLAAMFCGNQGLRGGIHAYAWRVRCEESGWMEFGAAEGKDVFAISEDLSTSPYTRRLTNVLVEDGDIVVLILDLIRGLVTTLRNGTIVPNFREGGVQRMTNHVLDFSYVTPVVVSRPHFCPRLVPVRGGVVVYSTSELELCIAEVAAYKAWAMEVAHYRAGRAQTVVTIPRETVTNKDFSELTATTGSVVQLNVFENVPLSSGWEFDIVGPRDVLLRDEIGEKSLANASSDWGHGGSSISYKFYCCAPGHAQLWFGFVNFSQVARPLDCAVLIHIRDPPEAPPQRGCVTS